MTATESHDPRDHLIEPAALGLDDEARAAFSRRAGRQRALLDGRACAPVLAGLDHLGLLEPGAPDLGVIDARLEAACGWRLAPVRGPLPEAVFLSLLADRALPVAAPAPGAGEDAVFHALFGHAPLLLERAYADFLEEYGRAGLEAARHGTRHRLSRLWAYAVEGGLAQTPQGLRLVGARLLCSEEEGVFALESPTAHRIRFDLARLMRTRPPEPGSTPLYVVLDAPDAWPRLDAAELAPLWRALDREPDIEPGALLPEDRVLSRGAA
jgi:phenylalanine-4-hydroxylase